MSEFVSLLEDEQKQAAETAKESHEASMNSYDAGYDAGYRDGLGRVLLLYREIDGTVK